LLDALGIMLMIVVPTIVATMCFAWWFRSTNKRATYRPNWVYSGKLEVLVWAIPALVVLFLGGVAWVGSHRLDPFVRLQSKLPPLEVEVVSLDWKWLFIYPDERVAIVNRLVLPLGRPVHLRLTSASVMNVFFVPRLAGEIYTMNGMSTELNLQANKTGVFPGLSAQFSGDGFSNMSFNTQIVTPAEFDQFIRQTQSAPARLDESAYRALSQPSLKEPVRFYGGVSDGLFSKIVSRELPPGNGPAPSLSANTK